MAALDFSSGGTLVPEKPLDFSQHGVPVDAPTPVNIAGPMAADAAAIAPLAKSDPNADSIGKALLGAQDVGSTLATRLTPAGMLPQLVGGAAGIGSLANENPTGNELVNAFIPAPVKIGAALANPAAVDRAVTAIQSGEKPLVYEPQTQAGKVVAAAPDYVFNKIGQGADYVGEKAMNVPVIGGPALAATANTATQLLPLLLGERAIRGGIDTARAVRAADLSRGDPRVMADIDADVETPHGTAISTNPADYGLANMLTKGATDTPAPTPAAGLGAMLDQVKASIAQNLNPAPVQPPPPAVAEGLKAVTDGDPKKIAAVIQKATGGNLKPGETPENLAQAVQDVPKPRGRLNLQTGKVEPVATENANAASRPVEVQQNSGGAGTGVDTSPVSPEAAASPAVVPVSESPNPPPPRVTPGVDKSKDLPLAGGVVKATPTIPAHVGIDKNLPQWIKVPEHVNENGEVFPESWVDQHEEIDQHEKKEEPHIEELGYQKAHDIHGNAATDAFARRHGMDPKVYRKAQEEQGGIEEARAKAENGNATNIDPNLDARPYVDGGDEHLLTNDSDLTDVRNSYLKGLADEIGWDQVGGKLMRAEVEPNSGALGEVTGRTTWEPKGRSDGNGPSGFWQSYKTREGANGLTIAGAKEALRKHLAGEKLTPKEKRFADFAEDQATKYMGEYAEEKAASDTLGRQDSKEQTQPPTDYSDYTKDYTKGDEAGGFTPQERHASRLDSLLSKLGPITDEQRAAITAHHGSVELDPVMGLPTRRELAPTIEAAKAEGGPASYGEVDIRGVGSLNSHMGSNSAADPHLRAIAQIVQRNVDDAANAFGGRGVVVRKGGDELGVIAHGVDPADLHRALGRARKEVDAYAKQHGLDKAKSAKVGGQDGVGLHYGVSRITPDGDIGSIIGAADRLVEARKKGDIGYEYTGQTEALGAKPSGGQTRGVVEGAGGGDRAGQGAGAALPDRALQGEPAETAVAERPVTQAAKPPPTKTPETVAEAAPENPQGVSARNAAVDADRARYGLDELPAAEREHWDEPTGEALARIAKDPSYPTTLAREVAAKPRPLTTAETMALVVDLKRLDEEHAAATQAIVDAQNAGDTNAEVRARLQRQDVLDAINTNHDAVRNGGTEAARSLSIRNAILKDDYSLGRNMNRAKAAYGKEFNTELQKQVEELSAKLKEKDDLIASMERKKQVDVNTRMQAKLSRDIAAMEEKLAKRLKVCPV